LTHVNGNLRETETCSSPVFHYSKFYCVISVDLFRNVAAVDLLPCGNVCCKLVCFCRSNIDTTVLTERREHFRLRSKFQYKYCIQ